MAHTILAQTKTRNARQEIPTLPAPHVLGWLGAFRRDPLQVLTRAREHGDLVRLQMGPRSLYVLNHPAHVQHVLQDAHRNFSKDTRALGFMKKIAGENLFTGEGEFWLKRRRLMQPMFHRQSIALFGDVFTRAADEMMQEWDTRDAQQPLRVDEEMMRVTLKIAGQALFSVDLTQEAQALGDAFSMANDDLIFRVQHPLYPPPVVPTPRNRRARATQRNIEHIILRTIRERATDPLARRDLLTLLMTMRDEETGEGLSEQELYRETLVMLFAGHETTSNALTWAFYFLSQHPDAESKLHAELDSTLQGRAPTMNDIPQLTYTRRVLDETMRLAPPAWVLGRMSLQQDAFGEFTLPARSMVLISPYTLHRHPRYWHNPDTFDPDRVEFAEQPPRFVYMPFGGGPRLCIGQPFALAEATLLLASIAQRYQLQLAPTARVECEPQITLRVKHGLPMRLTRRQHSV